MGRKCLGQGEQRVALGDLQLLLFRLLCLLEAGPEAVSLPQLSWAKPWGLELSQENPVPR